VANIESSGIHIVAYYRGVIVSGAMNPSVEGKYAVGGIYGGKPYYYSAAKGYYVWYHSTSKWWYISSTLGTTTTYRWSNANHPYLVDIYYPYGSSTGNVRVDNDIDKGIYAIVQFDA
jgi:hypothetical protein